MCKYGSKSVGGVPLSLLDRSGRGSEDAEEDDSGFVPSPLDLSVGYLHGGSDTEIDRELNKINEQARELENIRRED